MQRHVLICGGTGGIGRALVKLYCGQSDVASVTATYNRRSPENAYQHEKLSWQHLDVLQESSYSGVYPRDQPLHLVVNAVGALHDSKHMPEKTIRSVTSEYFMWQMQVNALPSLLLAKHVEPSLKLAHRAGDHKPVFCTVSARVGSISENQIGGWYSYRASKVCVSVCIRCMCVCRGYETIFVCIYMPNHPGGSQPGTQDPVDRVATHYALCGGGCTAPRHHGHRAVPALPEERQAREALHSRADGRVPSQSHRGE
jgi:NAD(P)-dependent dehydrogenase (short-subunit alcohol dehydrogenase family)